MINNAGVLCPSKSIRYRGRESGFIFEQVHKRPDRGRDRYERRIGCRKYMRGPRPTLKPLRLWTCSELGVKVIPTHWHPITEAMLARFSCVEQPVGL